LLAVATAIRLWAKRNPNEYALLYGSPVPGYEAPQYTVEPAARVALALGSIVANAGRTSTPSRTRARRVSLRTNGVLEMANLEEAMPGVPEAVRALALMVWSQIFGCISFELFGHYKGSVRNAHRFFTIVVDEVANLVLPAG
jgi:hypothetical protein